MDPHDAPPFRLAAFSIGEASSSSPSESLQASRNDKGRRISKNEIASSLRVSDYTFLVASTSRAASRFPLQLILRGAGRNFNLNFNRR